MNMSGEWDRTWSRPSGRRFGLLPTDPRAEGACGSVEVDGRTVKVIATGLPPASTFGNDVTTGRPFNVYEAWLVNSNTGVFASLGVMAKRNEEYTVTGTSPMPLAEFNMVVVSAEDTGGSQFISGMWVLAGALCRGMIVN